MKKTAILFAFVIAIFSSCKKNTTTTNTTTAPARLRFVFKFDSTQARLNGVGQPSVMPANHRGQSPRFNGLSGHYIEMAPGDYTPVGGGTVIYVTPTVTTGITTGTYTNAIDFSQESVVANNQEFFSIPLSQVTPGSYKWLRISVAYQNYDITYKYTYMSNPYFFNGTIASFIGYNTYIGTYKIKTQNSVINANKLQGYWGFETSYTINSVTSTTTTAGQSLPGATTVVNPLANTSAIPAGSCLVTGQFVGPTNTSPAQLLTITGHETKDIIITVSLSTNKSFEWVEHTNDNYYEPAAGDTVVDMGLRGMIPMIQPQ